MSQGDELQRAVLAANRAFYVAFNRGDLKSMIHLWAQRSQVACFHPGMPALVGREAVLSGFRQVLASSKGMNLRCYLPVVSVSGTTAMVICYEGAAGAPPHLAVTNLFVLEDDAWRMVHHHAGFLTSPLALEPRSTSSDPTLN